MRCQIALFEHAVSVKLAGQTGVLKDSKRLSAFVLDIIRRVNARKPSLLQAIQNKRHAGRIDPWIYFCWVRCTHRLIGNLRVERSPLKPWRIPDDGSLRSVRGGNALNDFLEIRLRSGAAAGDGEPVLRAKHPSLFVGRGALMRVYG